MDPQISHVCLLLAEALRYPAPGHLAALEKRLKELPAGSEKRNVSAFLDTVKTVSLGQWEELHTHTLDLNPPAAPYVGFQTWGESYQRGEFLSKMSRVVLENGIDADGELPDHLIPILRYLAKESSPLPDLVVVIEPAVQRMMTALRQADGNNPYLHLLEGILSVCRTLNKETV
jgi:nitrate reductase molybdenum cofactor assembly chaperone NarJ/NarW